MRQLLIFSYKATVECVGITNPLIPFSIKSAIPEFSLAITGHPAAIPSAAANPNPSLKEGNKSMSVSDNISGILE